jgi:hypothetical protein
LAGEEVKMHSDVFQARVLEELRAIRGLLDLVAADKIEEVQAYVREHYLTTPRRGQMWEQMTGTNSYADIGARCGVSGEAVSQFTEQLAGDRYKLVTVEQRNGAKFPKRLL